MKSFPIMLALACLALTACNPEGPAAPATAKGRPLEITFAYAQPDDEEEWRWGVRFTLASGGKVVPGSIQCFVAG